MAAAGGDPRRDIGSFLKAHWSGSIKTYIYSCVEGWWRAAGWKCEIYGVLYGIGEPFPHECGPGGACEGCRLCDGAMGQTIVRPSPHM
eukprot:1161026-Pelagomonas_calceolata.AAC.6